MDEGETIKQLRDLVEQLKRENELLKAKVVELEARLARYENAHTPPSLRRGGNLKKDQNEDAKGKRGQKKGHKGLTRPYAKPVKQIDVTRDRCPDCGANLGSPFKIESKIIEEIPEPQSAAVTEYRIAHYRCPLCQKVVTGTDAGCSDKGKFGNNAIAQATLLKYEDRLPTEKSKMR